MPTADGELTSSLAIAPDLLKQLSKAGTKVTAAISVMRTSDRLSGVSPIQFKKDVSVRLLPDLASCADPAHLKDFVLHADAQSAELMFADTTELAAGVSTQYDVKILHRLWNVLWLLPMGEGHVDRASLKVGPDGKLVIPVGSFVKPQDLLEHKDELYLEFTVTRANPALSAVFPMTFTREAQRLSFSAK